MRDHKMKSLRKHLAVAIMAAVTLAASQSGATPSLEPVPYGWLKDHTTGRATFQSVDVPAVYASQDDIYEVEGIAFGERFAGQSLTHGSAGSPLENFDILNGAPTAPLFLLAGAPSSNLSFIRHPDTGHVRLYAEGHIGFPEANSGGEGALAFIFDVPQSSFGFRVNAAAPGATYPQGRLHIECFNALGMPVASYTLQLATPGGVLQDVALRRPGDRRDIQGCAIQNNDPLGVSFDDFIFELPAPSLS